MNAFELWEASIAAEANLVRCKEALAHAEMARDMCGIASAHNFKVAMVAYLRNDVVCASARADLSKVSACGAFLDLLPRKGDG